MQILKSILVEELENSQRRIGAFEVELARLPQGSLQGKVISGKKYYYLVCWDSKLKKNIYRLLAEVPSKEELRRYEKAIAKRANFKNQIRILKLQIQFLKRSLNAREFSIAEEVAKAVE